MMKTLVTMIVALAGCHDGHGRHTAPEPKQSAVASPITEIGIAVPIAAGKTADWQHALEELVGPRYAEYDSSRRRFGLTSQTTFLQRTPMGDFAVIHLTGPDVHASFHAMSNSQDVWDIKWRELTRDLHGMDFAKGDRVLPKVVPLFSMDSADTSGTKQFMFLAPLAAGGADRLRAIAGEVIGARHAEYVRAREQLGIKREVVFLESTAMGDAIVVYWLADDPVASLRRLGASTNTFDTWLRGNAEQLHPISLDSITAIASANTLVAQYPH